MIEQQKQSIQTAGGLLEPQQMLSLCIDRMPFAYILWGPDLRVRDWNTAAGRIFGWSVQEARGKEAVELMLPSAGAAGRLSAAGAPVPWQRDEAHGRAGV